MKIVVDGQLIEYTSEGKGKVVVLLHGWGVDSTSFGGITRYLAEKFQVVRLDFPGFGGSPKPSSAWYVSNYASLVAGFIAKLNLDVYAFIGHSFGGRVIIKGISTKKFSAHKLVLIDTAGVKPAKSLKKHMYKLLAKTGKAATSLPGLRKLRPALREKLYGAAGSTDYLHANEMQQIFLNTINEDLLPLVRDIQLPTLLLWGENDKDTPVSDAFTLASHLADSHVVVVPNAGHFVFNDDPKAVQKELESFLS